MTTLLHPSAAADAAAAALPPTTGHAHSEALGGDQAGGVCCFQLAAPPSSASLRLMRAFMHQLEQRLELQAAGLRAGLPLGRASCAASHGESDDCGFPAFGKEVRASASAPPHPTAQAQAAMPADCFWASV